MKSSSLRCLQGLFARFCNLFTFAVSEWIGSKLIIVINNDHCYSEACQTLTTWHQDAKHYNVMLVKIFLFYCHQIILILEITLYLWRHAHQYIIFTLTKNKSMILQVNVKDKLNHVQGNLKHLKWVSSCYKTIYCPQWRHLLYIETHGGAGYNNCPSTNRNFHQRNIRLE